MRYVAVGTDSDRNDVRGERRNGEVLITTDGAPVGLAHDAGGPEPLADGSCSAKLADGPGSMPSARRASSCRKTVDGALGVGPVRRVGDEQRVMARARRLVRLVDGRIENDDVRA